MEYQPTMYCVDNHIKTVGELCKKAYMYYTEKTGQYPTVIEMNENDPGVVMDDVIVRKVKYIPRGCVRIFREE